jgi:hypothetical protein
MVKCEKPCARGGRRRSLFDGPAFGQSARFSGPAVHGGPEPAWRSRGLLPLKLTVAQVATVAWWTGLDGWGVGRSTHHAVGVSNQLYTVTWRKKRALFALP